MSNNGTGFWVIVALIAALSFVVMLEAAIATFRNLAGKLVHAVRRVLPGPGLRRG